MSIAKLIQAGTPFAIVQHFVFMKNSERRVAPEAKKVYECLRVKEGRKGTYPFISELTDADMEYFKQNRHLFKMVLNNCDGKVWEFKQFKTYIQKTVKPCVIAHLWPGYGRTEVAA